MRNEKRRLRPAAILMGMAVMVIAAAIYVMVGRKDEAEPLEMIFIPKVIDDSDFWTQMVEGARMAAQEYGVELRLAAAGKEDDYEGQNEWIEWAIGQKPDAILLAPSSYTETTAMARRVVENGIKLILIDSDIDEDLACSFIATDNVQAGELQGSYLRGMIGEDSRIAVIGHVRNSSTAMERAEGVRKGLGEEADRIAEVVYCDSDPDKAYRQMEALLKLYPDIDLVAGLNEYSAVGAARAVKDMGLTDSIRVVGFDSSLEEAQFLEEGVFQAIVIQKPFKMGFMGVEAAVKAVRGEAVLKKVNSGSALITRENMYTEENQKLLFPFREEK